MKAVTRHLVHAAFAAAGLLALAGGALAQAFPNRTVTIVVPYAPSGGTDVVARRMAQVLEKHWGQTVIVDNVPGADGIIGTQKALRAPADGYTLLLQLNTMLMWKLTETGSRDLVGDLRLISLIQTAPLSFAVSSKFPGNTMQDFVAHCKAATTPCSIGTATRYAQLISKQLMDVAGIGNAIGVSYKGGGPMTNDLLGGHVTMAVPSVASGLRYVQSGQMKMLAVGSEKRFPLSPNIPTLVENGWPVLGDSWYGLMVPKNVPNEVFNSIVQAVAAVSKDPGLRAAIEGGGGAPVFSTPEQFVEYARKERTLLNALLAKYPLSE
ncbi:tripartite tricarboxylate transporter substrate binding protein [Ramlibacter sp.]|uniref:tripartite tricarboxylate transporter substrate binding protein n=1 Tax=Ramlibacter sp. TaxID=1917967 RepID=UPI003D0C85C9